MPATCELTEVVEASTNTTTEHTWLTFTEPYTDDDMRRLEEVLGTETENKSYLPCILSVCGAFTKEEIATVLGHSNFDHQIVYGKFTEGQPFAPSKCLRRPPAFAVLAKDFEDEIASDCHSFVAKICRSTIFPQLVSRGKSIVTDIAGRLAASKPVPAGEFDEVQQAWLRVLNAIARKAGVLKQTLPDYSDVSQWITWARAFVAT